MRHLSLSEHATLEAVPLSVAERDSIARAIPSLSISPTTGSDGLFDLTPSSWVGAFRIDELTIEIRPKLPIERVLFLISYALDPGLWRHEALAFEEAPSLHEAVIPSFFHHVQTALRRGLLQGYRTEESAQLTVRGRIRFDDQIRRRFGIAPPVEVRYDEFTEDIAINRLIKAAIHRLSRLPIRSASARQSLRAFDGALRSVSLVEFDCRALPRVQWTRLNSHYRPAVTLAQLLLRGYVFESRPGDVPGSGFSVDMNQIFEDFVVVALREALGVSSNVLRQGDRSLRLDRQRRVRLEPDLTWWIGNRCTFVGDVKYKRIKAAGVLHPDLYQLLAYTVATDLPTGLLIYAAGEAESASHEVVHVSKRLNVVTLDLAGSIDDVLGQIQAVAARIRRSRRIDRVAA